MARNNKKPDYTGAKAHDYIDSYVNRPEDMGSVEGLQNILSACLIIIAISYTSFTLSPKNIKLSLTL